MRPVLDWLDLGLDPREVGTDVVRRTRIITAATCGLVAIGVPSAAQYWQLGLWELAAAILVVVLAAFANLLRLAHTAQPVLSANLALGLLTVLVTLTCTPTGGFYGASFAWLYVVPLGAAVVVPLRHAVAWLGITLLITVALWALPQLGVHVENQIPLEARAGQALFDRVSALLALAAIAGSFVVGQRRAERDFEASNAELLRETAYVSLLRHAAVAANKATSLDDALRAGVGGISATMGWPLGHALVVDDDGRLVSSGIFHVEDPEHFEPLRQATQAVRFEPNDGLAGRARALGAPQSLHDLAGRTGPRASLARALGVGTHLAVPVFAQGEVLAVLEFGVREELERDDRLLEVLADIGLQLGRVAERTALEERVRQAQKMEAIGQLAAGVAHEVNNPMAYVRTNLSTLRADWDRLREALEKDDGPSTAADRLAELEELIDESLEGVDRTIAIVRDVNEFSHAGGPLVERVSVDEVIESALRVASTRAATGVQVERSYAGPPPVRGSANQLHQVFVNLIANAFHAAGETGRVRLESEALGRETLVRVIDDGPGIPREHASRLFEPFFTTKPVGEGTGLGLYISYQIVHSHGGEIRVESTPGSGATFEVRLPVEESA